MDVCEFHGSNGNGFGDIWWTDNPIYFSSIDIFHVVVMFLAAPPTYLRRREWDVLVVIPAPANCGGTGRR